MVLLHKYFPLMLPDIRRAICALNYSRIWGARQVSSYHSRRQDSRLLATKTPPIALFRRLDGIVTKRAQQDQRAQLLMTVPGVGALISLTYVSAIDDPARFRSSRTAGAHLGLTQRKYQSGETDVTGRISKCGDQEVRTALYEAANIILTRPVKGSQLKSWAAKLAARAGMKKEKVALARKLAVFMHRMLSDGTCFDPKLAAA